MAKPGYIYILANKGRRLYTGVTTDLRVRVKQHKSKLDPKSFTARYNTNRLVYYEIFESINEAIARESTIKNFNRLRKIQMIVAFNRTWRDLSENWDKQVEPFDERRMKPPVSFS